MLSPSALADAAACAGLVPWDVDGTWFLPGHSERVPLDHPFVLCTAASWLRSDVVAIGAPDGHARYLDACRRINPEVITTGVVFCGDDVSIAASMVALGKWTLDYARLVLGFAQEAPPISR